MEAYFLRKALAMHQASLPQGVFLVELNHLRRDWLQNFSGCQDYIVSTCFDKNTVWVHHYTSASDGVSIVLIRTLPGGLSRLILP